MGERVGFPRAAFLVGALVAMALSGCVHQVRTYHGFDPDEQYINPGVLPGRYETTDLNFSSVLHLGRLTYGDPEIVRLRSHHEGGLLPVPGAEAENVAFITMAIWKPLNLSEEAMPVIIDAGPYFENGCLDGSAPPCVEGNRREIGIPQQRTGFLLKNYLPHGYAIVQLAVRGTGTSGGCMELMSDAEADDLSQAVDWLATQEWSNGNVAMIGASYDGSTPWMVAATGNPHLKTIVPVAGLPDLFGLMFRNGTSETRGPFMHSLVYWPYGFSEDFPVPDRALIGAAQGRQGYQDRQNVECPEAYEGAVMGPYATLAGDRGSVGTYWSERDRRARVLENYHGSVFLVHGLQDWNVDPHAAIPFNQALRDRGVEVKEWYGQWGHSFPDAVGLCQPKAVPLHFTSACRLDFAETLYQWFEHYLRGRNTTFGPELQVMDNRGHWRNEDSFPPRDATWTPLYATTEGSLAPSAGAEGSAVILPPNPAGAAPTHLLELRSEPFEADTRISGLLQLHVDFEALGPGGYLGAWLFDENATGDVLSRWAPAGINDRLRPVGIPIVGHAQMDLRFAAGGDDRQVLVPGSRSVAKMEFEPLDVLVPKGHRLTLWLFQYQYPDHAGSPVPSPVRIHFGGPQATVLRLPVVEVVPYDVFPVPGSHFPNPKDFERFNVPKPVFDEIVPPLWAWARANADCLDQHRQAILAPRGLLLDSLRFPEAPACRAFLS